MDPGNPSNVPGEDPVSTEPPLSLKPPQAAETKVRVAVRVRPFISKEVADNEQSCVSCFSQTNQIVIGKDKTFSFDNVFDSDSRQSEVFESCARDLVASCLAGYNTTILAYGQTGSGKTFTMGSNTTYETDDPGIIPRVMRELFNEIDKRRVKSEFILKVSFLEIYNEEIQDLLDTTTARFRHNQSYFNKNPIAIREEKDGSISVYGAREEKVGSYEEMTAYLEKGSLHRSTASTMMNESSSRSHAIFTISVEQHQIDDLYKKNVKAKSAGDSNFTMAKFHFVDLAGSERIKKTGASGAILREGININRGLLALGNVISALTDLSGKVSHVPYRESKLTRILQDSLGGNSRTVMIACISPAESNFDESLNTLKYASRARNIKNKPIVNRDPQSTLVSQLKQQIFELQGQLMAYKRALGSSGKENLIAESQLFGSVSFSEHHHLEGIETVKEEVKDLKIKIIQYEKELAMLNTELQQTKALLNQNEISVYSLQKDRDLLKLLNEKYKKVLEDNNIVVPAEDSEAEELERLSLVEEYSKTIEKLKQDLRDKDKLNAEVHREYESLMKDNTRDQQLLLEKTKFIQTLMSKIRLLEMPVLPIDISTPKSDITQTFDLATARSEAMPITEEFNLEIIEEDERMEREFLATSHLHKNEMLLFDGTLNEKEELLKNMTKNQFLLEKGLMDDMKNQYYKKIQNLEHELKLVEKQRDEALSKVTSSNLEGEKNKILAASKQKITDLEVKIKEFKKKEKEQTSMGKLVESQRSKITQLDDEIKKMKTQKIQLQKKIKDEAEKHDKWKSTREKELFEAKKMNMEKDLLINRLKIESKKKDFAYKKKADEMLSKYMSKELLGQIQSESKGRGQKKKKNLSNSLMVEDISNLSFDDQNLAITEEEAKQLLEYCGERMLDHLQLSYQIEREEDNIRKTEEELEIERHKQAELMLRRDRTELDRKNSASDLELESNLSLKVQEYDLELNEISTRVEGLEGKLDFQLNKANQLTDELMKRPKISPEQILLNNEKLLKNTGNMKLIMRCLFGKYIGANLDILKLHERMAQIAFDMTEMRKRMEESERRAKLNELQYEINLTKLTKEYERNQFVLLKQDAYDENEELNAEDELDEEGSGQDDAMSPLALTSNKGPDQIIERSDTLRRGSAVVLESPPKKRGLVNSASGSKGKATESVADQNKKLDKMVKDLTRNKAISEKLIDDLKRKNAILQTKYDQLKKATEKPSISKNASDDITQLRTGNGNITGNSIATDRSQYSTSTSMSINASFSVGTPSTARKLDDGEVSSRQRQDKSAKDLLNLSSLRDKRKEEKDKNKQTGQESDKAKPEAMTKSGTRKSVAKGPVKRAESPKRQGQADTTARKVGSQTDSIEESKGDGSVTKETANEESLKTSFEEEVFEESTDWKCHANIDAAHTSPILCVTSLGNMLYSSGHKTFKVWSLDTLSCISEIVVHTSSTKSIKAITIWPEKNLLATSCDKTVSLWDLVSLQNVGTLKGHKDEIKALTVCDNLLLSGGKGSSTYSALLAWDLRAPGPVEEKEKDQEIGSMIAHNGILYYGNQEHQIRSVNLTTMQSLAPFEPKHKDVVSSLAIIQDQLVSTSRDGTLNLWNLNHHILNLKHTATLPRSYVTTLESNRSQDLLYSGTRSGLIKIWNVDDEKLNCLGTLKGHKQSVNSICKLYDEYETMFASASSDKTIKIWKPTGEEDSDLTIKNAESMNKSQGIEFDEK